MLKDNLCVRPLSALAALPSPLPQRPPPHRMTTAASPSPAALQSCPITASAAFRRLAKKPPFRVLSASATKADLLPAFGVPALILPRPTASFSLTSTLTSIDRNSVTTGNRLIVHLYI